MTAERPLPRRLPRRLNALDLIANVRTKRVELTARDPQWLLKELAARYHIKIPDRLAHKMDFHKLNWYKFSPPMSMHPEETIAYLGFYGKRSRKNMDLESARMVIVRDASDNTRSLRIFGNIKDSTGVNRVVALTYSREDHRLTSAGFSLPDIDKALNLMGNIERFRNIPSTKSQDFLVTPAMIGQTESRRFSRISGFNREHHSFLVAFDDMEIRRQLNIHLGYQEDEAKVIIREGLRDYHFDFRHKPQEGRVFLGNWRVSLPRNLS